MRILPAGILVLFLSAPSHAVAECDTDIPTDASMSGYTIGEVHVDARWGKRIASERLRLRHGDAYSRAAIFDAMETAAAALNDGSVNQPFDLQTQRTFVRLVRPCVVVHESTKTADVRIRTYSTSLSFGDIASNLLSRPRSAEATSFAHVPAVIRLLQPSASVKSEHGTGTSVGGGLFSTTNRPASGGGASSAGPGRPLQLTARLDGARWLSERYYSVDGAIALSWSVPIGAIDHLTFESSRYMKALPLGTERLVRRGIKVAATAALKPARWLDTFDLSAAYASDRMAATTLDARGSDLRGDTGLRGVALAGGQLLGGAVRAAAWYERRSDAADDTYSRTATLAAYAREVPVRGEAGRHRHTLGIEAVFGAGRTSHHVPSYAQFHGGNAFDDFLYRDAPSVLAGDMPPGPLIRSGGLAQLSTTSGGGGRSYLSGSFTVSVPLPALARPLIPEEDDEPTLKQLIKTQALNTSHTFLSNSYVSDEGLSEEEADRRATEDVDAIRPAVTYIADSANLMAIRPMFLFDAGTLRAADRSASATRVGVGAGVQVVVVTLKLELGYMRAVRREASDRRGNLFIRMAITDLF